MKIPIAALLVLGVVGASSTALAEEKAPPRARGVIELDVTKIVGRSRPIVAADVGRATAKLPVSELRQPLLDRIEKAIEKDPF
jgi:hypothetical protein